jgi:hypothetical protein
MQHIILAQRSSDFSSYGSVSPVYLLCSLLIFIVAIAAVWRVFTKAGRPGWLAIIPLVNTVVLLQIAGKPWWWIILLIIPLLNLIILIIVMLDLARAFGKSTLFGIGLIILAPIFFLILGFDDSKYQGV